MNEGVFPIVQTVQPYGRFSAGSIKERGSRDTNSRLLIIEQHEGSRCSHDDIATPKRQ